MMAEILLIIGMVIMVGAIVARLLESRRMKSYEEYRRRYRDWRGEVEREARKRL